MKSGRLIISLDFELLWGRFDTTTAERYGDNILGARSAIPQVLELFQTRQIHATWATVGFLFCENKDQLNEIAPNSEPKYSTEKHSSYQHMKNVGFDEKEDPYHFAPSLIDEIRLTPGQEVGSHTFSHYYCLEPGQDLSDFSDDLKSAKEAARTKNLDLKTLVFPRNQTNKDYLESCEEFGIIAFRGTESNWFQKAKSRGKESFFRRGIRLLDHYIPISSRTSYSWSEIEDQTPINLPASRFLRPFSNRLKSFEKIRIQKIKNEMTVAAQKNEIYHLWWHPHNFGSHTERNLEQLESILTHFQCLKEKYDFRSRNMLEVANEFLENKS